MTEKKGSPVGQKKGREIAKLTLELEGENIGNYDIPIIPKNAMRQGKMYNEFCVLNQEFLRYILHQKMAISEYRILFFLLSNMDKDNKIIIDSDMIEYNLGINKTHVNKYIKKLVEKKIIYKRNLGYKNGQEVLINFDVISPHMVYKNKNRAAEVEAHKRNMRNDLPYHRQKNIEGGVDLIDNGTGEIFHSSENN